MEFKRKRPPRRVPQNMGRPNGFYRIDLEQVKKLACKGWTDEEMAEFFGVTPVTWWNWKNQFPDFFSSLKDWKLQYDQRVELSLAESAIGYSHREDKVFIHNGVPVIVPTIRHYPPNVTAMIFWLKNRQKEKWRDVHKVEHSGKDGGPIQTESKVKPAELDLSDFTDGELELLMSAGLKLKAGEDNPPSVTTEEES